MGLSIYRVDLAPLDITEFDRKTIAAVRDRLEATDDVVYALSEEEMEALSEDESIPAEQRKLIEELKKEARENGDCSIIIG